MTATTRMTLCALLAASWIVRTSDLGGWRWLYLGDSWDGYDFSLRFVDSLWLRRPLAQYVQLNGAYQMFPGILSWYHAAIMHYLTGVDMVGSKMANALHTLAAVAATAWLASRWYSGRAARLTAALLGSSWYWIAHDHTGYCGTRAALGISLVVLLLTDHRPWLAGLVAGLGWYDYATARLALPVACLYLWRAPAMRGRRYWIELCAACVVIVAPLAYWNGWRVLDIWYAQTAMTQGRSWQDMLAIARMNALTWWSWSPGWTGHFLAGPLLDPVTGALALIGIAWALMTIRDWRSQVLLGWLVGCFAATGGVSPHQRTADPRMLILMPPFILLVVAWLDRLPSWGAVPLCAFAVTASLVQWFWYVPTRTTIEPLSAAYHLLQDPRCRSAAHRSILVVPSAHVPNKARVAFTAAGGEIPLFRDSAPEPYCGCVVTLDPVSVRWPAGGCA